VILGGGEMVGSRGGFFSDLVDCFLFLLVFFGCGWVGFFMSVFLFAPPPPFLLGFFFDWRPSPPPTPNLISFSPVPHFGVALRREAGGEIEGSTGNGLT